jgi:hypothetical protein
LNSGARLQAGPFTSGGRNRLLEPLITVLVFIDPFYKLIELAVLPSESPKSGMHRFLFYV